MARALISGINHSIEGDAISLRWNVLFYGRDMNPPDMTECAVTLPDTATKTQARTAIRNAIAAEASRLGYTYAGTATLLEELFTGL